MKVQGNEGKKYLLSLNIVFICMHRLFFYILVYNLKFIALCQNFHFYEISALFGVNSFSLEIMIV